MDGVNPRRDEPEVVYGDSTPFPHGVEFLETTRAAVACIVQLLAAQQAIDGARELAARALAHTRKDEDRLDTMLKGVTSVVAAFRNSTSEAIVSTAVRVIEAVSGVVEAQRQAAQAQARLQIGRTDVATAEARELARRAVAQFMVAHDLPGTRLAMRVSATPTGYGAQAALASPFGVGAVFSLNIPEASPWKAPRRAGNILTGASLHIAECDARRGRVRRVKLDGLWLSEVTVGDGVSKITLRKRPVSGEGLGIELVEGDAPQVFVARLDEAGEVVGERDQLAGEDRTQVVTLNERLVDELCELALRRGELVHATFGQRPLDEQGDPKEIATRMVAVLAPVVREIAARSGAPGELVLRKSIGGGRREELYITKAELLALVARLPPNLRRVVEPLGLGEAPRALVAVAG